MRDDVVGNLSDPLRLNQRDHPALTAAVHDAGQQRRHGLTARERLRREHVALGEREHRRVSLAADDAPVDTGDRVTRAPDLGLRVDLAEVEHDGPAAVEREADRERDRVGVVLVERHVLVWPADDQGAEFAERPELGLGVDHAG